MSDSAEDKPKIFVDEDWKSRVERERAEQKETSQGPAPSGTAAGPAREDAQDEGVTVRQSQGPLPAASFEVLVSTLATQALACLGQLPDPLEQKPIVHLDLAQHHIDMLAMLEQKTKGNLTVDERHALDDMLHQLRMLFVMVKQHVSQ
jgi:hypothetical protein